jgi:di/tricarboxylate transporter
MIAAYRVIANKRRALVFLCSWLLPLPVLFVLLFGNAFLFGPNGDQIQGMTFLGLPLIVLVIDLVAVIVLMRWGVPVLISPDEQTRL